MLLPIPASIIRAGKLRDMTSRLCPKTEAHAKGLDSRLSQVLYGIAFDQSDISEMARQTATAAAKTETRRDPGPTGRNEPPRLLRNKAKWRFPPDPLQIADLTGGGGWTRTNDLRIMRPSL